MKAVKSIAALIFLALVAIVLVQPVLGADEDPAPKPKRGSDAQGRDPDDGSDEGAEEPDDGSEEAPDLALSARYPKRCLRRMPAAPTGLVAARRGSTVSVGLPGAAQPAARFDVEGDVAWSPSGKYLAERGGQLYDAAGTPRGRIFFQPEQWQWSPVADCVLALTANGNLTYGIPEGRLGVQLVDAPVAEFELSPNGRRLALVVDGGGLWIANLRNRQVEQVTPGRASLVGWFSNRSALYSKSPGSGKLRYADGGGKTRVVKGVSADETLSRCRDRTVVSGVGPDPLSELVASRKGKIVRATFGGTPDAYDGFSGVACSPDGTFVVASAVTGSGERGPLVLMEKYGRLVREVVSGRTANPTWTSEGVLVAVFDAGDRGRLWLIPPTGSPTPTAYTVGAPTQYDWNAR